MNYEEDLAYANSILKVRLMMENRDSIFRINQINQDTFEYLTYRNCVLYSLGILKEKTTVNSLNCFSHILIHDRNITKLLNGHDRYCYIDATETGGDWYFQQSLVLEPSVLRQLLIFNVLASVPSEYEYFQLNMKTFNYFIQG